MADTTVDPLRTGQESSLSNWVGPYVSQMLAKGSALSESPYQAYMGPLSAGPSDLQQKAFSGIAGLPNPTFSNFTPKSFTDSGIASQYMNPYLQQSLQPQIDEARRQAEIQRVQDAGRLTKAGAYGGSRQAIMESEGNRNLASNLAGITGAGYNTAFNNAQNQFNTEQNLGLASTNANNNTNTGILNTTASLGDTQRGIEQQGIDADYKQFQEERDDPFKKVQYQQSLLQGLPTATSSYSYAEPSAINKFLGSAGGIMELLNGWGDLTGGTT